MKEKDVDQFDEELEYRPRPKWPAAVLLLLVLGGGAGWFIYGLATATDPLKVLVAIDFEGHWFEGSKPAARLADDLNGQLTELGFEVVSGGDPEVVAVLEEHADDLPTAARKLKASYLIAGRVGTEIIEHPVGDEGYHEVRATGRLTVQHVKDDTPQVHEVSSWSGAVKKERALMLLADRVFARKVTAALVPALIDHPVLSAALRGTDGDNKSMDAKITARLRKAEAYVQVRGRALSTAEKAYAAVRIRRLEQEKGAAQVAYHGTMRESDSLVGAGPDGFLVKTEDEELYVDPRNSKLRRLEALEKLTWKAADETGTTGRVLWAGYNVYSYPGVTADGTVAALVEDLFGWAKTVTLIGADGGATRLRIDAEKRFSNLTPSPTGKAVAFYQRDCRRCPDSLVVLDAAGAERFVTESEGGVFEGYAWLDDDRLLVMHTPAKRPEGQDDDAAIAAVEGKLFTAIDETIWVLDISAAKAKLEAVYVVSEGVELDWIRASRDGKKAAFAAWDQDGPAVAVLDIAAHAMDFHAAPGRTSAPNFSADGSLIAFNVWPEGKGGDEEVAIVPTAGGPAKVLTDNPHRDRYPYFSPDGSRIYFESLGKDPNFPKKRSIGVIASVGVPQ